MSYLCHLGVDLNVTKVVDIMYCDPGAVGGFYIQSKFHEIPIAERGKHIRRFGGLSSFLC